MYTSQFEQARVLLAEPDVALRRRIVAQLQAAGYDGIIQTGNLAGVRNALMEGGVDLVVADTVMPEGDLCEMVWKLRHGQIGDNPFTVVVALITERTADVVRKAVNAGVDDVVLKPFDLNSLMDRIQSLTRGRKRFVVTSDYIGPDRRTSYRPEGQQVPLIRVPNPLEMRISGGMTREEMRRVLDQAYSTVNREKVERHVYQLDWLSGRLEPHIMGRDRLSPETFVAYLTRLAAVATDLTQRIRTTDLKHLGALCMTLERVSRECAAAPTERDKERWRLLLRLLDSLPRACDPARGGVAPRALEEAEATGVSPLLDKNAGTDFGPGGRIVRSV